MTRLRVSCLGEFDDLAKETANEVRPEPNWEGSYECQNCFELVYQAFYDPQTQTLSWWCSEGHHSFIKDFVL